MKTGRSLQEAMLEMAVVPGDIVQAGVMISNSEVGLGSVSVQPLVYRLVCTNGMVVNDMGERKNHVGRAAKAVDDSFHIDHGGVEQGVPPEAAGCNAGGNRGEPVCLGR